MGCVRRLVIQQVELARLGGLGEPMPLVPKDPAWIDHIGETLPKSAVAALHVAARLEQAGFKPKGIINTAFNGVETVFTQRDKP